VNSICRPGTAPIAGKTAILVDDGIATGLTMLAAIPRYQKTPARPGGGHHPGGAAGHRRASVAGGGRGGRLEITSRYLGAVGAYYDYFPQISDAEVIDLMQAAAAS